MGNQCGKSKDSKYRVDGESDEKKGTHAAAAKTSSGTAAAATATVSQDARIGTYPGAKVKLDPKDYKFEGLKGEVKVKPPGSINGQAFTIDQCQDCDIYLVDHCAQVTIDECINCRIFIGPTDGSIFIRDSKKCKCAFLTRQLRTRGCDSCDVALLCRTRPVIEASTNMGFSCYNFNYESLPAQLTAVRLSIFHNFWSHIYDFTPKPENWRIMSESEGSVEQLLFGKTGIPDAAKEAFGAAYGAEGPLLSTWGDRTPAPSPDYLFVMFSEQQLDKAMQFANQAKHQAIILRSNQAVVSFNVAANIVKIAGWSRSVERAISSGAAVGFEISGKGCQQMLRGVAHALGGHESECEEAGALFRFLGIDG